MEPTIYIDHMSFALGDCKRSVDETFTACKTFSSATVLRESGFQYHFVCDDKSSVYSLAKNTMHGIEESLLATGEQLSDIDAILYASCLTLNGNLGAWSDFHESSDVKHLMDFPVSHLHADFHLDNAFVMGLNQTACTSLLGAVRVAKAFLVAEPTLSKILCITADRFPPGAIYEQGYNLISDGAAACIIRRDHGPFKVIDCHHITNGAMAQASDDETAGFYFNYTHRVITEVLKRNALTVEDINWVVPQNTNVKAWEVLSSILRIDYAKVLMPTRESIGHCISGDNIINLKTAHEQSRFADGEKILMPMAGFGLNWSCLILEKVG